MIYDPLQLHNVILVPKLKKKIVNIRSSLNELKFLYQSLTIMRSGQTVQTQIRLLLEEQSDQGLHCLQFHLHVFDIIPSGFGLFV